MSNLLSLPNTNLISIKSVIQEARQKKKAVPKETKEEIISLLGSGHDPTSFSQSLGIARRTLSRWSNEIGRPPVPEHRPAPDRIKSSPNLCKARPSGTWKDYLSANFAAFGGTFLLIEGFLISQNIKYFQRLDISTLEVYTRAAIAELSPIMISCLIGHQLKTRKKVILYLGLVLSFLFSIYCSSASKNNQVMKEVNKATVLQKEEASIENAITKKDELISFYQSQKQSSGVVGWPQTIKKMEKQKGLLLIKLEKVQGKLKDTMRNSTQYTNMVFDLIFKLLAQLVVVLIISSAGQLRKN